MYFTYQRSARNCHLNFHSLLLKLFAVNLISSHTFPLRLNSLFLLVFRSIPFQCSRSTASMRLCRHQFHRCIRHLDSLPFLLCFFSLPLPHRLAKIKNLFSWHFKHFPIFLFLLFPIVDDFSACNCLLIYIFHPWFTVRYKNVVNLLYQEFSEASSNNSSNSNHLFLARAKITNERAKLFRNDDSYTVCHISCDGTPAALCKN